MEVIPLNKENAILTKVNDINDYRHLDKEQRKEFIVALRRYCDYSFTIDEACNLDLQEGYSAAFWEGFLQGFLEGYEKEQQDAAMKIAAAMKAEGLDTALIVSVTGLSASDIAPL